jgi:DNA polymerase-4
LIRYSHQSTLKVSTDVTNEIYESACQLFDQVWQGEPIRHLRVRLSQLKPKHLSQRIIFGAKEREKLQDLDKAVDQLRDKYGDRVLQRGVFINSKMAPTAGGVGEEDYKMMSSIL